MGRHRPRRRARRTPTPRLVPFLTVGATDARFFRRLGQTAYGFGLFSRHLSLEDYGVMFHGDDERVDVESLRLSTELWEHLAQELLDVTAHPRRPVGLRRRAVVEPVRGVRRATRRDRGLPAGFIRQVNATNPAHQRVGPLRAHRARPRRLRRRVRRRVRGASATGSPGADVLALLGGELRPAMFDAVRRCRDARARHRAAHQQRGADAGAGLGRRARPRRALRRRRRVGRRRRPQARAGRLRAGAREDGPAPPSRSCSSTTSASTSSRRRRWA